ncbi:integrator complex subunit 11-like [Dysidea avara]|uniref:integrator complex subunit 11-like n=1 Tax=Dysidea avara TaxID=196820 RepID=UPI00332E5CE2
MSTIRVVPLGAGQDVGRSCILVSIGGKCVMLDCGMHMGYNDSRRFPDFTYVAESGRLTEHIDCVIISHFHLDHCGSLPYFSEMVGYDGPIYMTHPTKAIAPILLEDFRRISVDKKGDTNFFTSQMIKTCMKKVITVNLHQTIQVDDELQIKAYYAGHVLGAAMFEVIVGTQSFVYTGDYNMTPDRHLGAASIDKCRPDLLITECTYATTIRDSKRLREVKYQCPGSSTFDKSLTSQPGPMVVFATPGMLHAGQSLNLFKNWAEDEKNMLIMPGYCVAGTIGHKVLSGMKKIEIDKKMINVRMSVQYMSFSAHADAKGIMQLIRQAEPKNVMLVHGEAEKMEFLKQKVVQEFGIDCFMPANGETVAITTQSDIPVKISDRLLKRTLKDYTNFLPAKKALLKPSQYPIEGVLVMKDEAVELIDRSEAESQLGLMPHEVKFSCIINPDVRSTEPHQLPDKLHNVVEKLLPDHNIVRLSEYCIGIDYSSVVVEIPEPNMTKIKVSWDFKHNQLGESVYSKLQMNISRLL